MASRSITASRHRLQESGKQLCTSFSACDSKSVLEEQGPLSRHPLTPPSLIAYGFGCELWAPWSEEMGRRPVLQASLFLVNIWQILAALAPNFGSLIVARTLGGLSSAGGSVTLAMVADMWKPADQQFAVAYVVFSSVAGSVVGPVIGGFVQQYASLKWIFWVQLIFGVTVQLSTSSPSPRLEAPFYWTKRPSDSASQENTQMCTDQTNFEAASGNA